MFPLKPLPLFSSACMPVISWGPMMHVEVGKGSTAVWWGRTVRYWIMWGKGQKS